MIDVKANIRYNDSSNYFKHIAGGNKVQKISINAGFTCPNRDGTRGRGGCTYCLNQSFNPNYQASGKSITQQLQEGARIFSYKYPGMKFLAYFQSFTNTYAPLSVLSTYYKEALRFPGVIGLSISTRPDCLTNETLNYLEELAKDYHIALEIGIESTLDRSLNLINRGHTFAETRDAVYRAAARGLHVTGHLILGLPGETRKEMMEHGTVISEWPVQNLKLHQLQVLKHTHMAGEYKNRPENFSLFNYEDYIEFLVDFIETLHPDLILERFVSQAPKGYLIAPQWGQIKNYQVLQQLNKRLEARNTWQGRLYRNS